MVAAEGDGCADGLALGDAPAGALAAGAAEADPPAVGSALGVIAGTLGAADGCAAGAWVGAPEGTAGRGGADGETLGLCAASGDAEVAVLAALADGEGCADELEVGAALAVELGAGEAEAKALAVVTVLPERLGVGVAAVFAVTQLAAWVDLSSPLPKMFACTAAAAVVAEKRIATAMPAERDRLPRLGSSARSSYRRLRCFRLVAPVFVFRQIAAPEAGRCDRPPGL
jgi:hypothetical protein